jgi:hypothetical protein
VRIAVARSVFTDVTRDLPAETVADIAAMSGYRDLEDALDDFVATVDAVCGVEGDQ